MNQRRLTQDNAAAAGLSPSSLLARQGDETFYAFVLDTDEDCSTVESAANSLERLDAKWRELDNLDATERASHRWAGAEWAYAAHALQPFDAICRQLGTTCAKVSGDAQTFAGFRAKVHIAMIEALKLFDDEAFFGHHRSPSTITQPALLLITASEDDETEAMEARSAGGLNSPEICKEFLDTRSNAG